MEAYVGRTFEVFYQIICDAYQTRRPKVLDSLALATYSQDCDWPSKKQPANTSTLICIMNPIIFDTLIVPKYFSSLNCLNPQKFRKAYSLVQ